MKVFLDVTSLLPKSLNGPGTYTKQLFRLLRSIGVDVLPVYKVPPGYKENCIEEHINIPAKKSMGMFISKGTIHHGPNGMLLSDNGKLIKIISINDLSMFHEGLVDPKVAQNLRNQMKRQMNQDIAAVIVPSQDVQKEFSVLFPKMMKKIHVVPPGADHLIDSSVAQGKEVSKHPFFLFVGTLDKKSNVSGVIKAFQAFCSIRPSVNLVLAANNGFGSDAIHKMIESSGVKDRIRVVSSHNESLLKKLYSDAIATVIPSYYESFSYTMIESMRMSCPVVTSAIPTLKNVGKEGVHLVNPKDPEQILGAMERIYIDREYRLDLVQQGKEVTQNMSWLQCAKDVAQIYQSFEG